MADIELLDKVIAIIEAYPGSWNQDSYRCASGMCVAGWVGELLGEWVVPQSKLMDPAYPPSLAEYVYAEMGATVPVRLHPDGRDDPILQEPVEAEPVQYFAARHLGINPEQADVLFHYNNTLDDIKGYRDQLAADPNAVLYSPDDDDAYDDDLWAPEPVGGES